MSFKCVLNQFYGEMRPKEWRKEGTDSKHPTPSSVKYPGGSVSGCV